MKLEVGRTYITKGKYLVEIKSYDSITCRYTSTTRTSPGVNLCNDDVQKARGSLGGWVYSEDGSINGLKEEWTKNLTIEAECPFNLSDIPADFTWDGKFPQLREIKEGEAYLGKTKNKFHLITRKYYICNSYDGLGTLRLPLVPIKNEIQLEVGKTYITADNHIVEVEKKHGNGWDLFQISHRTSYSMTASGFTNKSYGSGWIYEDNGNIWTIAKNNHNMKIVKECPFSLKDIPKGYTWKGEFPQLPKIEGRPYCLSDLPLIPDDSPKPSLGEPEMKKETLVSVSKGTGTLGFRLANYWLFEPAANLARPLIRGFRYAVFTAVLGTAVYGVYNPSVVVNFLKSCVPHVTIEAPEIMSE